MPQEAFGRGLDSLAFKDLDTETRERRIREADPDDLRAALGLERVETEDRLNALGPQAREETKGEAGRLNARVQGLTDIGHAIGWWENLMATGVAPREFEQFVDTAGRNLRMIPGVALPQFPNAALPGNVELVQGILAAAKAWGSSGRRRKYTVEAFNARDQAVADRKARQQAELEEIARARFARGLEAVESEPAEQPQPHPVPDSRWQPQPVEPESRPTESQPEQRQQEQRQEEARQSVERVYGREEIIDAIRDFAHGRTFISTEVPGHGFKMNSGVGEGRTTEVTARYVAPTDELKQARKYHALEDWTYSPSETWAFTPVVTRVLKTEHYTETVKKGRKTEEIHKTREVVDEEKEPHSVKIRNPQGLEEPAVLFQYLFEESKGAPTGSGRKGYRALAGGRLGNYLAVAFLIPASMSENLKAIAEEDRMRAQALIRKIVEEVVVKNSDDRITQELWDKGQRGYPMKPPYGDLPSTWEMDFFDATGSLADDPEHPAYGIDTTRTYNTLVKTFGDKSAPYRHQVFKAA